jgi:hypothetical protein
MGHVKRASAMAPGGVALWIGPEPAASLPLGFEWRFVTAQETRELPRAHFRLVVAAELEGATDADKLLDEGGILVQRGFGWRRSDLRVLDVDGDSEPVLTTFRRDG